MPFNSRAKGHGFEREVAGIISKKYNITSKKYKWKRVPLSGGFDKANFPGDIFTTHPYSNQEGCIANKFSIECKFHKEWKFENLLNPSGSKIIKWWKQAVSDARHGDKYPMLVFKKNNSHIYCMTYTSYIDVYSISGPLSVATLTLTNREATNGHVTIMKFETMLDIIWLHDGILTSSTDPRS